MSRIKIFPIVTVLLILVACADKQIKPRVEDPETTPTQVSLDLVSVESKNGVQSYRMKAPLMERYELAANPFAEFKRGINVETFNDSTRMVESDLVADYARFDETNEIWEVRGNVVGRNIAEDRTIYSEQLFWDQKKDKIYTDKFARVLEGQSIHQGTGFEADGDFKTWIFRTTRGRMELNQADSTSTSDSTIVEDSVLN